MGPSLVNKMLMGFLDLVEEVAAFPRSVIKVSHDTVEDRQASQAKGRAPCAMAHATRGVTHAGIRHH